MKRSTKKNPTFKSLIAAVLCLVPGLIWAQAGPAEFIGSDPNWFNPANWSTGLVPDEHTDVRIPPGALAQIDPAAGPMPVIVRDVDVADGATLRLLPGSRLEHHRLLIDDGLVEAFSAEISGDEFEMGSSRASMEPGISLQPTTNDNRSIKITSKTTVMHLGGLSPASAGNTGAGHYAVMRAEEIELGAELQIELAYGFEPSLGDSFEIVQASQSLSGRFAGLPEGALAAVFDSLALQVSYASGDSVVLTAVPAPVRFVGDNSNWFDPTNWSTGTVPDSDTDVLLDGTAQMVIDPALNPDGVESPVALRDLFLIDDGRLDTEPGTRLSLRHLILYQNRYGGLQVRGSAMIAETITLAGKPPPGDPELMTTFGCSECDWGGGGNPSLIQADQFNLHYGTFRFFLGGSEPATVDQLGAGFYANIRAREISLINASIELDYAHGYRPRGGERFVLMQAEESFSRIESFRKLLLPPNVFGERKTALLLEDQADAVIIRAAALELFNDRFEAQP